MSDALDIAMERLSAIARDVAEGRRTHEEVQPDVADACTEHGPTAVRLLDRFFECKIDRWRRVIDGAGR